MQAPGGGLASVFKEHKKEKELESSGGSFGFVFLSSEDVAVSLLAEEELREKEGEALHEGSHGKKRGKRGKRKEKIVVSISIKSEKIEEQNGEKERIQAELGDKGEAEDQGLEKDGGSEKKTTALVEGGAIKESGLPSAAGGDTADVKIAQSEEGCGNGSIRKKTRRGGKKAKHRNGNKGVNVQIDSDEDWYDPQPQPHLAAAAPRPEKVTNFVDKKEPADSDDKIFFRKEAKGDGRNLVALGPTKVRNSAWAEGESDKVSSIQSSLGDGNKVESHDSPFAFGFQLI